MNPTLVAITGLPLSGKTTLVRTLAPSLQMHCCDIDNVLKLAFGGLDEKQYADRWENPQKATEITEQEMKMGYILLHHIVEFSLEMNRSLIICATYSRKSSQEFLERAVRKHNARLRMIVCHFSDNRQEEIERRLDREDNRGIVYGPKSLAHYETVRSRFQSPATSGIFREEEVLVIDTSAPIVDMGPLVDFVLK